MFNEILDILKSLVSSQTKVDPPETLQYDTARDEFVMFDRKRHVIDFALLVGIWPSSLIAYEEDSMAYALWTGYSAKTLKKRVNLDKTI